MAKKSLPWMQPLGLNAGDFKERPRGFNPLIWGLLNRVIDEDQYVQWASLHYGLPAIKGEFFSMAVDFSLIEKYKNLYAWSETCYPIYQWDDVLYVACLEPPQTEINQKVCFVISPFQAMKTAWDNSPIEKPQASNDLTEENNIDSDQVPAAPVDDQAPVTPEADLGDLDFSSMIDESAPTPVAETGPPPTPTPESQEEMPEFTQTDIEGGLNDSTSATSTLHANAVITPPVMNEDVELAFENLETEGFSLEGDPKAEEQTETETQTFVSDPLLHRGKPDSQYDDDYTPVPIVTQTELEAQEKRRQEFLETEPIEPESTENTVVDTSPAAHVPPANEITKDDLLNAAQLDGSKDLKHVVAHMFNHLQRDYKKMIWVEKGDHGQYYPQYVYGSWNMILDSWRTPLNLANPNIFRVAFLSGHPFHGEIHGNPFNDKYFELWNRKRTPDFATIFPVVVDQSLIGFVGCFDRNQEFDEVDSLKKIENLVSISKNAFQQHKPRAAA